MPDEWAILSSVNEAPLNARYMTDPAVIKIGQPFDLRLVFCAEDGDVVVDDISMDAIMPKHLHGMNYRPDISSLADGGHLASGLFFHMQGVWRISVSVYQANGNTEFFVDLDVK